MKIKPISIWTSLAFFGGAALLVLLTERFIVPKLASMGVHHVWNFLILRSPHMVFFIVALIAYRSEGHVWSFKALKDRFRIYPLKRKMWLPVLAFGAINIGLYLLVFWLGHPLLIWIRDIFPTPEIVFEVMGKKPMFAGYNMVGNWWLLGLFFVTYFFNIMGEELLWRGYIFPRQQLTYGKRAWIVHGLLWTGFHLFAPYNALLVLPGALFMSYIVQKYNNTTIFIISHAMINAIPMIALITGILN